MRGRSERLFGSFLALSGTFAASLLCQIVQMLDQVVGPCQIECVRTLVQKFHNVNPVAASC
jgi:hypothetical protein